MTKRLPPRLRFSLLALTLPLLACSQTDYTQEHYALQSLPPTGWLPEARYTFPLLFAGSEEQQRVALFLRLDSRLDRPEASFLVRLRYRSELLRSDTLTLTFAPRRGDWRSAGIFYHEYTATLAQPLHVAHTGLYHMEISLLDSLPLSGVAQLGLHSQRLPHVATPHQP